ncbi:gluconokinase [Tengunoibacter tsumagoiensis]|uniref:Gluconate kinase n=1 Tax=Tengunoibacter tsumagoiensis TaxID=2014871 RepID=A0A402A3T0_9CHLR|nr:gluconokinase [Tengunoibacter tsumagoiensis]GCE13803.1 gluconate kinase [Tengunoibacter tsumagoiensis]
MSTKYHTPLILALDIGTSSTRAILFDGTGTTIDGMSSQHTYPLQTSVAGEASVDADTLVGVVAQTITEVLQKAGTQAKEIAAVAMDTFWHSLLGVDASNRPVTPVITWEDTRPFSAAMELRQQLNEKSTHDRVGVRFHASYWPAKLRWLHKEQPELFQKVTQWISFGEYLHRCFLGRSICSLSMASATGLLNSSTQQWDHELTDFLELHDKQLPELGDSHDGLTGLTGSYASSWPVLHQVPWYPALGDGATACIGSGCATPTNWSLTMGTSSAIRVVGVATNVVPPLGLWRYLVDARRPVIGGALSEGGNLIAWMDNSLQLPPIKEIEPLIKDLAPDSHGLTILPFLSGERSLGWHADARMTVAGISNHTTPAELMRAGMEALGYRLYTIHEELRSLLTMGLTDHKLIASGGALLSSPTLQGIVADTLNTAIYPSIEHEASARGAALLALEALGVIKDVAEIAPTIHEPVQPNANRTALYQKAAARQQQLYQLLLPA